MEFRHRPDSLCRSPEGCKPVAVSKGIVLCTKLPSLTLAMFVEHQQAGHLHQEMRTSSAGPLSLGHLCVSLFHLQHPLITMCQKKETIKGESIKDIGGLTNALGQHIWLSLSTHTCRDCPSLA